MPSSAQGLFLASYTGIPPGGAHINLSDIGTNVVSAACKTSTLPLSNFSAQPKLLLDS